MAPTNLRAVIGTTIGFSLGLAFLIGPPLGSPLKLEHPAQGCSLHSTQLRAAASTAPSSGLQPPKHTAHRAAASTAHSTQGCSLQSTQHTGLQPPKHPAHRAAASTAPTVTASSTQGCSLPSAHGCCFPTHMVAGSPTRVQRLQARCWTTPTVRTRSSARASGSRSPTWR